MSARTKFLLWTGFSTGLAAFALYQLYRAMIHGEVYSGPLGFAGYVDFASEPFWFAFGVAVYLITFSVFTMATYLSVQSEIRGERAWRRKASRPQLENAIRRSKHEGHV